MKQVLLSEVVSKNYATSRSPKRISDYRYLRLKRPPYYPEWDETVRIADVYAGVGSLSLGAWEACRRLGLGFECVAAVDNNIAPLRVYGDNFPKARIFHNDVNELVDGRLGAKPTKKERAFVREIGVVDFLLSGSPCQGFSPLNNRTRGRDIRNALYLRSTRLAEITYPEHILFENVPDVLHGEIDVVGASTDVLRRVGYNTDDAIVDLFDIGVPQHRRRHVLVASRTKHVSIDSIISRCEVTSKRDVKWAIWDLEMEKPSGKFTTSATLSTRNLERIKYLNRTRLYDLPNWMRPLCHRGRHSYKAMYGRLKYTDAAQTVTGGFGSPGQGRFIHPTQPRTLTPHEAARLQFFPDFFSFASTVTRTSLASMLGNAAPMKLSLVVGLSLLRDNIGDEN